MRQKPGAINSRRFGRLGKEIEMEMNPRKGELQGRNYGTKYTGRNSTLHKQDIQLNMEQQCTMGVDPRKRTELCMEGYKTARIHRRGSLPDQDNREEDWKDNTVYFRKKKRTKNGRRKN